jgi:hypothetical protein
MTGKSTSYSQDIQTLTNIYVDGFRIDTIETPKDYDDIREVAMTPAVIDLLEGREIATIVPVPKTYPRFIIITTDL